MNKNRLTDPLSLAYLKTEAEFTRALEAALGERPDDPLVGGLSTLKQGLLDRTILPEALETAARAPLSSPNADPMLVALFLLHWANAALVAGRAPETEILLKRADGILEGGAPPEITVYRLRISAQIALASGDTAEAERLYRDTLRILPRTSPRWRGASLNVCFFHATLGRADEVADEIRWLSSQRDENFKPQEVALVRFVDAVETGRLDEAAGVLPELENDPSLPRYFGERFTSRRILYGLLRGELPSGGKLPAWALATRLLAARRPHEALAEARRETGEDAGRPRAFFGTGFPGFTLLRTELATGNAAAARRILAERRRLGNVHYLDPFFEARLARLAGDAPGAAGLLAAAFANAERHRALERLDFEIRLACEFPPASLFALARSLEARPPAPPRKAEDPAPGASSLAGETPAIRKVRDAIARFAPLDATVLVTGETGTGKELVARALHEASTRREHPFIAVDCGAIAETLLESELFGHERGAFTGADRPRRGLFEAAGEGTLFLDEIGNIPPGMQAALLRVLENGEIRPVGTSATRTVRCRVVAATNVDLERAAVEGRFRQDLFFRLSRLSLVLPPLRERSADIPVLTRRFLDAGRPPGQSASLSEALVRELSRRPWPGNVRELKNAVERMRLLHSDKLSYDLADLDPSATAVTDKTVPSGPVPDAAAPPAPAADRSTLRRRERLRDMFRKRRTLTRIEIARAFGICGNTATEDLKALLAENLVEKVTPNRSPRTHYFRLRKAVSRP